MVTDAAAPVDADRVGIVYSVTGALLDLGGNVLELSQTVMRGYFTIILAAKGISSKNGFIQVFSMHNLVWFIGMFVLSIGAGTELFFLFLLGVIVSALAVIIVLVRGHEERQQDPDYTDF